MRSFLILVLISFFPLLIPEIAEARSLCATETPPGYPGFRITSPQAGDVVQGQVLIESNNVPINFKSAELEFSFSENPTDTWFLISSLEKNSQNNVLGEWDTTTITDGEYTLRLRIISVDGQEYNINVPHIRVRNYTPIETYPSTPINQTLVATIIATEVKVTNEPSTLTPLPPNPGEISQGDLKKSIFQGMLVVLLFFIIGGFYIKIRDRLQ